MRARRERAVAVALLVLLAGCARDVRGPRVDTEPIDETRQPAYLKLVHDRIRGNWSYPCAATRDLDCDYRNARLVVDVGIHQSGRVDSVTVVESSSFVEYDDNAVAAINRASPFPAVPPSLMAAAAPGSAGITVRIRFKYVLERR